MKDVDFVGSGRHRDGTPVLVFVAELRDGRDTHGKFETRFVMARLDDGEPHLGIHVVETDEHYWMDPQMSADFIHQLLTHQEFTVAIDYENLTYEAPWGDGVFLPVLGRTLGQRFDWVETNRMRPEDLEAIHDMRDILEDAGHVPRSLQDHSEPDSITCPICEMEGIETKNGFYGHLQKHDADERSRALDEVDLPD